MNSGEVADRLNKKWICCLAAAALFHFSACGNARFSEQAALNEESQKIMADESGRKMTAEHADSTKKVDLEAESMPEVENSGKILVAYFTRLSNTESGDNLDAVVQGGGPYGEIGENFKNADMDAVSSASVTVTEEGVKGNVETVAGWIAEYTGADLFSIETVHKYPLDYDVLIDQGGEEQKQQYRPELAAHIENIDQYSVIYLGYPNWYHDMPMALYSFLEEYDFQGKIIIPFATSAGSGLANTVSAIADLQPKAEVIEDGLSLGMREVKNSQAQVMEWIDSLGMKP